MVIIVSVSKIKLGNNIYNLKDNEARKSIDTISDDLNTIKTKIEGLGSIISGMIMIWSGSSDNIPDGWVLCNGQNGTPDLTDKFILGAGNTYSVGDTGGEASHKLTLNEIPSHKHTGTTEGSGGHNHTIGTDKDAYYTTYGDCWSVHNASTGASYYNGSTNWVNNHTHSFATNNVGGEQAHNNMPPYYALCYIMKS